MHRIGDQGGGMADNADNRFGQGENQVRQSADQSDSLSRGICFITAFRGIMVIFGHSRISITFRRP